MVHPLVSAGLLPADWPVTINAISGYSGGGKKMIADYEAKGDGAPAMQPYALTFEHKHLPEMAQYSLFWRGPLFVPNVGNFYKGMLEIIPLPLSPLLPSAEKVHEILSEHFAAIPAGFVSVAPLEAVSKSDDLDPELLNGTNEMHLHVFGNEDAGRVVVFAVYDNLGKGASGAAVQNLNLMIGADPKAGL